jgi:hypothetical protein
MFMDYLVLITDWPSKTYAVDWKIWDTPSGRTLFQLWPSEPATAETGFGLWGVVILANGEKAMVDWHDMELVNQHKWHLAQGYARATTAGEKIMMHLLIMGKREGMEVDHINGNKLDNRRNNLRHVPKWVNCLNKPPQKNGAVWFSKRHQKWRAEMWIEKKKTYIGIYETKEEAVKAYEAKKAEVLTPFAKKQIKMLPTPQARDGRGAAVKTRDDLDSMVEMGSTKGGIGQKTGLKLQPELVEWMMGLPEDYLDLPMEKLSPPPDSEQNA